MAGERTLPGLGLTGFWTPGSDGWDAQMDVNWLKLSALAQGVALSRVTALPGSPTNGQVYIVPSGAGSHPNEIAIRDNGAWVYVTPGNGWRVWVVDEAAMVVWGGSAWSVFYQAPDSDLTAIAALVSAPNKLPYATGAGAWAMADFTAIGRALAAAASAQAVCAEIGAPWVAGQSAVSAAHTGDTVESTLAAITVPANAIGPNGQVEIVSLWSTTNNANAKTPRVKFGSMTVQSTAITNAASYQVYSRIANRGTTNSQVAFPGSAPGLGASATAAVTAAIDTTASVSVTLTGQLATSTDTITLESYLVRVTYGA